MFALYLLRVGMCLLWFAMGLRWFVAILVYLS